MTLRLFGCRITVSPLFMGMVTVTLLIDTTGMMGLLLGAMLLHEAGHLVWMALFRCLPKEICFLPFEINMIADEVALSRRQQGLIAAGGIFMNGLFFLVCPGPFGRINLFLAVFNGLPVYSMDGWQLLCLLIGGFAHGEGIMRSVCVVTATGLLLVSVGMLVKEHNPMLLLFLLYMGLLGIREKKMQTNG